MRQLREITASSKDTAISPAFYAVVMFSLSGVLVATMSSKAGERLVEKV